LADRLKKEFGVKTKLVKGSGGVFEVMLDGELIFSKKSEGRFPDHEEIISRIKSRSS
jgi:selenoprotein W-related protein